MTEHKHSDTEAMKELMDIAQLRQRLEQSAEAISDTEAEALQRRRQQLLREHRLATVNAGDASGSSSEAIVGKEVGFSSAWPKVWQQQGKWLAASALAMALVITVLPSQLLQPNETALVSLDTLEYMDLLLSLEEEGGVVLEGAEFDRALRALAWQEEEYL